ncbi:metalloregulator ArsR/SmtB family transcription factor [Rhodovulum sp. DZ06]|uniref:metalloregulator ArsR/SmtB family transcription factor n=1 Tax=Rhodovulum sp. DZ06 TaxID=3425126 RepID=UPI003D34948C
MTRLEREAAALAALGSPARLDVFRLLARHAPHAVPAGKIAEALGRRPNTLSVQVAALVRAGLVEGRREGKSILYRVAPERLAELMSWLSEDCCGGRPETCAPDAAPAVFPAPAPRRTAPLVLFLCRTNGARSILAEAMVNQRAGGKLRAASAGVEPAAALDPETVEILSRMGADPADYAPKSVQSLGGEGGAAPAFVLTLCDAAANADLHVSGGRPYRSHWPIPDPAGVRDAAWRRDAFRQAADEISTRVNALLALDLGALAPPQFQDAIDRIGMTG